MFRIVAVVAFGLVALAAASLAGGYVWLRTSLPTVSGEVAVSGLEAPVRIARDGNGIPSIQARSLHDAYFALGYVHAQDRLWQMEFARRAGAGRLAEVLGVPALATDKFIRALDLYSAAGLSVGSLSAETRAGLTAYAAGVNAFLGSRRGALPPEFLLLGFEPEPWAPADTVVIQKLMALRLGRNWTIELLRARIANALKAKGLPADRAFELWPPNPVDEPISIHTATHGWVSADLPSPDRPAREILVGGGSNGWLVHGSRTESGKPILANDPHLRFEVPINWYLIGVETPVWQAVGATLPGVPFMPFGHNGMIAHGITNGGADVQDLFRERIDPDNPARYLTPDGVADFGTRSETFQVKGAEPVTIAVRETRHGPVISDIHERSASVVTEDQVLTFASTALATDDRSLDGLYGINHAANTAEFLRAARLLQAPHLNLFVASTDGDICLISPGRIPVRKTGDGRAIAPGDDGAHDWLGEIPTDELPYACNPDSGILVNANNRVADDDYPHVIAADSNLPFRAMRIIEALEARPMHSIETSAALQLDVASVAARQVVPLLLQTVPGTEQERQAIDLLSTWDFRMLRDRPEPLIYAAWLRTLILAMIADELGDDLAEEYLAEVFSPGPLFAAVALTETSHWCDDVGTEETESCGTLLHETLARTLGELRRSFGSEITAWRWGDAHTATFAHQIFTHIPIVKQWSDLTIASDGGDETVSSGEMFRRGGTPFTHVDGSGLRAIYDLSDLNMSQFIIATGQSGNPLSPRYGDMLRRWRNGAYVRIPSGEAERNVLTLSVSDSG